MTKEELWQALLAQIQFNISAANFATWFKNTSISDKKDGKAIISVPNNFTKEWLNSKYNKLILKILHNLDEKIKETEYVVIRCAGLKINKKPRTFLPDASQLEFQEFNIDRETNLNPRYTFKNFIVGPFNELAHAAAVAVVKKPGLVYNPLFIYGGVGLGKTHLIQAIGNEVVENISKKRIKYIPSEKFTSEMVASIRNHSIENFKSAYKEIDVLVIDDIQFLAGKEKTQEEFFNVFNYLYEKNKQIIISSDRSPKAIPTLEERLRSRFEGGMIADIGSPDFETRIAILKTKAQEKKVVFSDDIFEYISSNIQNNIRELEGALNRLIAYQKINNEPVNFNTTKIVLKNIISAPFKLVKPKRIIQSVAEFYDLKENDIIAASRKKEVVKPRQIVMYFLRKELKCSFPFIGRKLGGRDHTTAIYGYEKIIKKLKDDDDLNEEINLIKQKIYSS